MVIGSIRGDPYHPGDIIRGRYVLSETEEVPMAFLVIRPATYDEWFTYRSGAGRYMPPDHAAPGWRFYLVTTD